MRKIKRFRPRALPFRSLLILAGAFLLLAAFAPRANADCPGCIRYYNFEGAPTGPYPVNLDSHIPAFEVGPGFRMFLNTGTDPTMAATGAYPAANTTPAPGLIHVAPGDPNPNLTSLGVTRSGQHQLYMDIPMFSAGGIYKLPS